MHKIVIGSFLLIITASAISAEAPLQPYPTVLSKLPQQELGQVILKFMPNKNTNRIGWDYRANDTSIVWIDNSYQEIDNGDGTFESSRKGVARINVNGVKSTYLKQRVYELPWSIMMKGERGKFGVNSVNFYPATASRENENICFGEVYGNCEFKPFKSLERSKIAYKKLCEKIDNGINFKIAYLLSNKGKQDTFAIWSSSSGSGGSWTEFELYYNTNKNEVCKVVADYY